MGKIVPNSRVPIYLSIKKAPYISAYISNKNNLATSCLPLK